MIRFCLLLLFPFLSHATPASPASEALGSLIQLLPSLILIIGLIFASLWLLRRLSLPRGVSGPLMRILTAQAVGPRERVVLVEVGGRWLVLGVAPGSVRALTEMPAQDLPAPQAAQGDFARWLAAARARGNSPAKDAREAEQ